MNHKSLNGHFEECLAEINTILKDSGLTAEEAKESCIRKALDDGFTPTQVIDMMLVSVYFEKARTSSLLSKPMKGKMISICVIKNFAKRFDPYFSSSDDLVDATERLLRVAYRNKGVFHFPGNTHISTVMKRAIQIAQQIECYDLDELVCFLDGEEDGVVHSLREEVFEELECCLSSAS